MPVCHLWYQRSCSSSVHLHFEWLSIQCDAHCYLPCHLVFWAHVDFVIRFRSFNSNGWKIFFPILVVDRLQIQMDWSVSSSVFLPNTSFRYDDASSISDNLPPWTSTPLTYFGRNHIESINRQPFWLSVTCSAPHPFCTGCRCHSENLHLIFLWRICRNLRCLHRLPPTLPVATGFARSLVVTIDPAFFSVGSCSLNICLRMSALFILQTSLSLRCPFISEVNSQSAFNFLDDVTYSITALAWNTVAQAKTEPQDPEGRFCGAATYNQHS